MFRRLGNTAYAVVSRDLQLQTLCLWSCNRTHWINTMNSLQQKADEPEVSAGAEQGEKLTDQPLNLVVGHNKKEREFYIRLLQHKDVTDDDKAYLQYEIIRKNFVDLVHTVVPESFRGRGVAKILAKAAMDFAVDNNYKMRLTCTYLQKYYEENPLPQYKERIVP